MNLQNFRIEKQQTPDNDYKVYGDITNNGAVLALYGSKAVAAGVSAAVSSVLAFLTMPFKGTQANSLKVGK
jgi:hypothetical protein